MLRRETLHTKGIFTRHGSLTGSMNITFSGVNINDEHLVYTISKEAIAQDYLVCEIFSGALIRYGSLNVTQYKQRFG